jgi:predicted amidohydrolase
MPYLTWVMSKFMGLGFSLEQVVAMATNNPRAVINRAPKLGSLKVGAPGDVAVLKSSRGRCRSSTRATTSAMEGQQALVRSKKSAALAGAEFGCFCTSTCWSPVDL